jgi:hypothetical protein
MSTGCSVLYPWNSHSLPVNEVVFSDERHKVFLALRLFSLSNNSNLRYRQWCKWMMFEFIYNCTCSHINVIIPFVTFYTPHCTRDILMLRFPPVDPTSRLNRQQCLQSQSTVIRWLASKHNNDFLGQDISCLNGTWMLIVFRRVRHWILFLVT